MKSKWEYSTFGQIMTPAIVERCKSRSDLPVLSITMHDGIVFQSSRFKKVIASVSTEDYKIVRNGQLVIAFPIDEGLIYTQDVADMGIMSPAYSVWNVDYSKVERHFLVKYFHSPNAMQYYKSKLRGTTQRRRTLPKDDLLSMPIPIPSIEEQQRIVAELDLLTSVIDKRKMQLKELDTLAQSIFYDMFGDFSGTECALVELCRSKDDIKCGPFGTQLSKSEYQSEGVAVWGIPQINSHFAIAPSDYVSDEKAVALKDYSVVSGDIVMSRKGNVGQCSVFPDSFEAGIIHSDVLRLRLDYDKANPVFMMYQLHLSDSIKHQIQLVSSGAIMPGINVTKLKNIKVLVPPLTLQQSFADKIQSIENQKAKIKASIADTQKLLDYTMDKYFG